MLNATAITGVGWGNGLSCLVCSWVRRATAGMSHHAGAVNGPSILPIWTSLATSSASGHRHDVGVISSGRSRGYKNGVRRVIGVLCI